MQRSSQIAVSNAKKMITVAIAAALLVPLVAANTADVPDGIDVGSAWRGPWTPSIGDAETERFIALWAPRILDNAWFSAYVAEEGYAPEILAEGFHALETHDKMFLVDRLFTHFLDTAPPFAAQFATLPEVERTRQLDEMKTMMTMFIFNKEAWQDAIAGIGEPHEPVPELPPMEDDGVLEAAIAPMRDATPLALAPAILPAELQAPVALEVATAALFEEHRVRGDVLWSGEFLPEAPLSDADVVLESPAAAQPLDLAPHIAPPDPSNLLALGRDVIDASTYRICAAGTVGGESCSPDVPLGTVVPVDVTGDALPDATGRLGLSADPTFPLGVTFEFEVRSLSGVTGPTLGQVTAVFEVPSALKRVVVGFDGRDSSLSTASTLRFTLKDLAAAIADDVQARVSITHDTMPAPNTLVFAVKDLEPTALAGIIPGLGEGAESNPITGAFRFDPVPASFVLDAGFRSSTSGTEYVFDVATSPTRIDALLIQQQTDANSEQRFLATIDELPSQVHIAFTQPNGAVGAGTATYSASAPIDLFRLTNIQTPNLAVASTRTVLEAQITDVPKDVTFTLSKPFQVQYSASGVVSEARVSIASYDGTLKQRLTGIATDVPKTVSLTATTGASTVITYGASTAMTSLVASVYDRDRDQTNAIATITGIPTSMEARVTAPAITFTAAQPIGEIDVKFSQNGAGYYMFPQDHATFYSSGTARGASLQLTGLRAFSADPSNGGAYSLTLTPGGQRFTAYANLEGTRQAYLDISALPATMSVDLRPGTSSFSYAAPTAISGLTAWYSDSTSGLYASVGLTGLPATVDVSWTAAAQNVITYSASSALTSVDVFVRTATGGPTFAADIDNLPRWMQVRTAADSFSFDARSSPTAAAGSASVGSILVRFGSDGSFLSGTPSGNHGALLQTATLTRASLLYQGLERLVVSNVNDQLHIELENSAPRVFQVAADTPAALLTGLVDAVPARIVVDHAGTLTQYRASSAISRIVVDFDKRDGQFVTVDIRGVPDSIDLQFEPASNRVLWTASAPLTSITVTGALQNAGRMWDLLLQITTVPRQFEVTFSSTTTRFRGITGALGSVFATVSNHGAVTTFAGNHASGVYRSATGNVDASFRMTSINLAEFIKGSNGFNADMRMGGGSGFYVNGDIVSGTTAAVLRATVTNLPTSIQLSQLGDAFTYNANANFDLSAYAEIGNVAGITNSPAPPSIRGLSVRDGFGCTGSGFFLVCGTGIKASLFLQGFPTALSADASNRVVSVTNFRPPADSFFCFPWGGCFTVDRDSLSLDVHLDNVVSSAVKLTARQDGIPSPMTMTFGPITTETLSGGSKRTSILYTASAGMGSFVADVAMGTNAGRLEISNIPSSVNVQVVTGSDTSTVSITNSAVITRIFAAAKASVSAGSFAAGITLTDIPTSVSLSFGKVTYTPSASESYTMPGLSYSASGSTLDITAFVDAAMFGGDLKARATLGVTNLGASTTMGWSGGELVMASSPATGLLEIHVWGSYKVLKHFSGCYPSCSNWLRISWGHHAGVVPLTVNDLKVKATSFSLIKIKPGVTTGIRGTYGGFEFGWNSISAKLDIELAVNAVADFGWLGCICVNVISYNNHNTITVNIVFHLGTDHMSTGGSMLHISSPIPCSWTTAYDLHVEVNPHPHFKQTNGFAISSASAEGEGWLVTPNPWGILPDKAVWAAAALTSPQGGGFALTTPCH